MIKLDARGKSCPLPVIEAKKALESPEGMDGLILLVDNEIAVQNLTKLAESLNYQTTVTCLNQTTYQVHFSPLGTAPILEDTKPTTTAVNASIIFICSETFGSGDEQLGSALMKSFLYSLTEANQLPSTVILCNGGVKLALAKAATLASLKQLEEHGSKILSCGACLDFYQCTEQLAVGSITNMYTITDILTTNSHIIRI